MTKRRPPMPRAGSGQNAPAPQHHADPAPSSAPPTPRPRSTPPVQVPAQNERSEQEPQLAKVIPLGKINDLADSQTHAPRNAHKTAKHVGVPHEAGSGAEHKVHKRAQAQPTAKNPKAKKQKSSDSERRIEDRTLLSGAVRKDQKAAKKQQPKQVQGPAKPIPARSFSGRILALSIAMSAFALLLVPSIGTYARQHEELVALRESIASKEAEQENLKDQIARWDDPLYIKQQARDRINLVMPGERNYMVVGTIPTDIPAAEENHSPNEIRTDLPWVDALYDSVHRAATD